jgi:hypothetical protein
LDEELGEGETSDEMKEEEEEAAPGLTNFVTPSPDLGSSDDGNEGEEGEEGKEGGTGEEVNAR